MSVNACAIRDTRTACAVQDTRKACVSVCGKGGFVDILDQVGNTIESIEAPGNYTVLIVGAIRDTRPQTQPVDFAIKDPRV